MNRCEQPPLPQLSFVDDPGVRQRADTLVEEFGEHASLIAESKAETALAVGDHNAHRLWRALKSEVGGILWRARKQRSATG